MEEKTHLDRETDALKTAMVGLHTKKQQLEQDKFNLEGTRKDLENERETIRLYVLSA